MTVLATDSMLNRIEDAIKGKIEGMAKGTYRLTWGTVNEPDMAKQRFPSAEIHLVDEDNLDDPDGAWNGVYMQECTYEITVRVRLQKESSTPEYEIDKELNLALEDLKRLFGTEYMLGNSTCAQIMYRGMRRVRDQAGDLLTPAHMVTTWRVSYMQDRKSPSTSADA